MTDKKPLGRTGTLWGIPFEEDPNAPKGQLYFVNDKYTEFVRIDIRSQWQRIKDWFKRLYK